LHETGETHKTIALPEAIVESRENIRASEDDKATLLPPLLSGLSTFYGRTGKIKKFLEICNVALEVSRKYNNLKYVPGIIYNIACGKRRLGEEEHILKGYLVEAYYCARAIADRNQRRRLGYTLALQSL